MASKELEKLGGRLLALFSQKSQHVIPDKLVAIKVDLFAGALSYLRPWVKQGTLTSWVTGEKIKGSEVSTTGLYIKNTTQKIAWGVVAGVPALITGITRLLADLGAWPDKLLEREARSYSALSPQSIGIGIVRVVTYPLRIITAVPNVISDILNTLVFNAPLEYGKGKAQQSKHRQDVPLMHQNPKNQAKQVEKTNEKKSNSNIPSFQSSSGGTEGEHLTHFTHSSFVVAHNGANGAKRDTKVEKSESRSSFSFH